MRVSMHFVLWGLHQPTVFISPDLVSVFQCTSCFGVFINVKSKTIVPSAGICFNALRALGSSSTRAWTSNACKWGSFNALRALGSSSTWNRGIRCQIFQVSMHFVLWGLHQLTDTRIAREGYREFQCTSCFGVFINQNVFGASFGEVTVSMHFVLWGLHQHTIYVIATPVQECFNALRALGSSSTLER